MKPSKNTVVPIFNEYYGRNKTLFQHFVHTISPLISHRLAVAEHYGLQNTMCLYSKDIASNKCIV
jgi:hypothetical protein